MSKENICLNIEGMNVEEAEKYAKQRGYEIRIKERNGIPNFITTDYREDRITVKVDNNNCIKEAEVN